MMNTGKEKSEIRAREISGDLNVSALRFTDKFFTFFLPKLEKKLSIAKLRETHSNEHTGIQKG